MLKKRLMFALLYDDGYFMLSRNFKLQRVGDHQWLAKNYVFSKIAFSIDELVIIDVSRGQRNLDIFCKSIRDVTEECFVPITAGGGIRSIEEAQHILRSGADKIIINTLLYENPKEVTRIASKFGNQSIVASIDLKRDENDYRVMIENGQKRIEKNASDWINRVSKMPVGEIYLNSIDQDGTAQGLDLSILELLEKEFPVPLILTGGAGHHNHILEAITDLRVDTVSTAHLFNFVGDGLSKCREGLIEMGMDLAKWEK